jgi:hypothetical protein
MKTCIQSKVAIALPNNLVARVIEDCWLVYQQSQKILKLSNSIFMSGEPLAAC